MNLRHFMNSMAKYVPRDARIMGCQFRGDPNDDIKGKWVARVIDRLEAIDPDANVYLSVSAMKRNARGEFRRRKENFAGGLLLMIDDIGTGKGAKHDPKIIEKLKPTALVETSPDNFQAIYMFNSLVDDIALFDRLIKAFIRAQFLGNDPGMSGVNRVFRPPTGINGKVKYRDEQGHPFRVRLADWTGFRYSVETIVEAFGLTLAAKRTPRGATADKAENIRRFIEVRRVLREAGMVKSADTNLEGWWDIRCPWAAGHTGEVDNGAAIREPAEENGWTGAFRCHHGSCADRGWKDLTEWLATEAEELTASINERAPEVWPWL